MTKTLCRECICADFDRTSGVCHRRPPGEHGFPRIYFHAYCYEGERRNDLPPEITVPLKPKK